MIIIIFVVICSQSKQVIGWCYVEVDTSPKLACFPTKAKIRLSMRIFNVFVFNSFVVDYYSCNWRKC